MAWLREIKQLKTYVGRMERGEDLLRTIEGFARSNKIQLARVEAIGSLEKASVAYYNQKDFKYASIDLEGPLEILNFTANLSLRDNRPVLHGHVTLSDFKGRAFGGHLVEGATVFACEFFIHEYRGTELHRDNDKATGLPLWIAPPVK